MKARTFANLLFVFVLLASSVGALSASAAPAPEVNASPAPSLGFTAPAPRVTTAVAVDESPTLRELAAKAAPRALASASADAEPFDIRPDRGPEVADQGYSGDGALQGANAAQSAAIALAATIPGPIQNFEGISNTDNFNIFGFRVNPPDPVGDVGPQPLRRDGQPGLRRLR